MKKILLSLVFAISAIAAHAQEPAVTMTTSMSIGQTAYFYVATLSSTTIQADWGDGNKVDFAVGTSPTSISGNVAGSTIKLYGSGITYLYVSYNSITSIDVSAATSLQTLYIDSNNISAIDLSGNTALKELYCYNNSLGTLDLSTNTSLEKLNCYSNNLTTLNLSANTNLFSLDCSDNQLASLDLTNNTSLFKLDCSNNLLTSISLVNGISDLRCNNNLLTNLDVSSVTSLFLLDCSYNSIASLDLTSNTNLQFLICNNNQLAELNLTNNTLLTEVYCSDNKFTLVTLPLKDPDWSTYSYSPQAKFQLPKNNYSIGEEVDLGSQLTVNGVNTVYTWKTTGGQTLTSGTDYTENNGIFTFNIGQTDSLYCEMTNTNFPDLTLITTTIAVPLPVPAIIMTTTTPIGSTFSFEIAATVDNAPIQVDWGNGSLESFTIGTGSTSVTGTLIDSTIKIYGVRIWLLSVIDKQLTNLDVSRTATLTNLYCQINKLTTIDVTQNTFLDNYYCSFNNLSELNITNNTKLSNLDCSFNNLKELNISNNSAILLLQCTSNHLTTLDVSKNTTLTYLACGYNQLTTLDVTQNTALTELYCYDNQLSTLNVSKNTALKQLDCNDNQLTTLDVTQNTALTYIDCSSNQLMTLDVTQNTSLTSLYCDNNQLRFSTLPLRQPSWTDYYYSPQAKLPLPKAEYELNEEIDLSSQLTAGGNTTVYTWKTAGGITLVKDVDYTESNGKFTFLKTYTDSVYCEMTNASFPDLTLSSTSIKVYIPEPNIIMSTTKSIGSLFSFNIMASINNTPITIDWGDGTMVSDTVGTVSAPIEGNLLGNTVKIWGKNITYLNVMINKLTDLDVSNCLSLLDLNCKYNQLSTIDLTGNTELLRFDCLGNNLKAIDLSQNSKLEYLSCGYNNINALNISNNTKLTQLYCFGNNISSIDITNNTLLKDLDLSDNQVKLLDISNNNALEIVKCYNNWFTFSSLPIKQASWLTYVYSPQYNYLLDKVYSPNEEINLSEQLSINGNTTQYVWKTKTGQTLISGTDYTENSGRFTFPTALSDSIYCEMTNATFPDLTLATTFTAIQPVPSITITTAMEVGSQFMFGMEGVADNTPIQIDWGDGVLESYTINSYYVGFSYPLKGSEIRIWGTGVRLLDVTNRQVTRLNVSKAKTLGSLRCSNNMLDTLDLSGCSVLFSVECTGNAMTSLTLPSTSTLKYVTCENNSLTFATLPAKQPSWTSYTYSPQAKLSLPKKTYEVNETIDLSNQLVVGSSNTIYTWKTTGGATLVKDVDYTVSSGVFKFKNTFMDSLYCEMTNATFPDLTLATENIAVPVKPAIIMTTTTPVGSTFSFGIAANADNTPIQVDWGNGSLESFTIGNSSTTITGTLTGSTIKIYGTGIWLLKVENKQLTILDVTNNAALTSLVCDYNQLTSLDVSNNTALTNLSCDNNQLTTLNVSKNTALTYLDCGSNQLTTLDVTQNTSLTNLNCYYNQLTTLDMNKNTALTYLDCETNHLTTLNIIQNTALEYLNCNNNPLTTLDVSKNSELTDLICGSNYLTTLDVTQNIALKYLYCGYSKLTTLDVSKNSALKDIMCGSNQLTNLDVSKNTALTYLHCSNNQLTTLDVSNNTALTTLYCAYNQLTTLDVTQNTSLTDLYCDNNQLRFSTLPLRQPSWTTYIYSPQAKFSLPKTEFALNEEIDLSSQLTAGGNTAIYTWKTAGGITLVKDVDYTESNGKFTFVKQPGDYFYCEMTNATFPDLTLATENIFITQTEPAITMTTTTPVGSTFSFEIDATVDNASIQVNWGNGTLAGYTIGTSTSTISGTLAGSTIKIYGFGITKVDISEKNLTSVDVKSCKSIKEFYCYNNAINSLDVEGLSALTIIHCYSNGMTTLNVKNCPSLSTLYCYYNELTSLNTNGCNSLKLLYCTGNKITSLSVSGNQNLEELGCTDNNLATLDLTQNTKLKLLGCSNNKLTSIDLSSNTLLYRLHLANNQLSSINLSNNPLINRLDIPGNWLTFSLLPIKTSTLTNYIYSPQRSIILAKKQYGLTETVDLSSELTIDGKTTSYIWKTKGGLTLVAGTDYNVTGGVTTFLKVQSDSVYCQMTNATFPDLTLTTTNIKVSQFPLSVVDSEYAVKVYPNPATDNFSIEMAEEIVKVEVYTLTGVKVFENGLYNSTRVTVPTGNMPKGALVVKTYTRHGVYESKVIKI